MPSYYGIPYVPLHPDYNMDRKDVEEIVQKTVIECTLALSREDYIKKLERLRDELERLLDELKRRQTNKQTLGILVNC